MLDARAGLRNDIPEPEGDSLQLRSNMRKFFVGKGGKNTVFEGTFSRPRGPQHRECSIVLLSLDEGSKWRNAIIGDTFSTLSAGRLPDALDTVGVEGGIPGNDRQRFFLCLGDEQPVEGVSVMTLERCTAHDLTESDFELLEAVQGHLIGQIPVDDARQAKLVEAYLDGDFPKAREADEAIVRSHRLA